MLDQFTFFIYTCCGKAIHIECKQKFHGSELSDASKNNCPCCRATQNDEEVMDRLWEWAQKKKPWALEMLGDRYRQGDGAGQNDGYEAGVAFAAGLYKLAADQGHHQSQYNIGIMYADGNGVTQSAEILAFKYLKLSAEQGVFDAQFNIGCMYAEGQGVEKSLTKAKNGLKELTCKVTQMPLQHLSK